MGIKILLAVSSLAILALALGYYFSLSTRITDFEIRGVYNSTSLLLISNATGVFYETQTIKNNMTMYLKYLNGEIYRSLDNDEWEPEYKTNNDNLRIETSSINIETTVSGKLKILNVEYNNEKLNIILENEIPSKFGDYNVNYFKFGSTESIINVPMKIMNSDKDTETFNGRRLGNVNLFPETKCLIDLISKSYSLGSNNVYEGTCNYKGSNKTVLAIQGTNNNLLSDIPADLKGVVDNFKNGYTILKNLDRNKKYDICTGHSLGGAIVKYMGTIGNNCGQIITFGTPLTIYKSSIPIQQYITVKDGGESITNCCDYTWYGSCKSYGMVFRDPVSLIGAIGGTHTNLNYITEAKNNVCIGGLVNTIFNGGLGLHMQYLSL